MTETDCAVCHKCGGLAPHERDAKGVENRARCLLCGNLFASTPPAWARTDPAWKPAPITDPLEQRLEEASARLQRARDLLAMAEHSAHRAGAARNTDAVCIIHRRRLAIAEQRFTRARLKWEAAPQSLNRDRSTRGT